VSPPTPSPEPYRVETAGVVNRALEALQDRTAATGFEQEYLDALAQIFRILRTYPQYGETLRELRQHGQVIYVTLAFTIQPLFVEYILDEANRRVFVVEPFKVMPHSSFI
jgi:hypothetical protein